MTPLHLAIGLVCGICLGVGFLAGHVWTGWREGIGPFAPRVRVDPEQLQRMGRAARLPRGHQRSAMRVVR